MKGVQRISRTKGCVSLSPTLTSPTPTPNLRPFRPTLAA